MLSVWARLSAALGFSLRDRKRIDEKKIAEAIFYACACDDEGSDDEAHSAYSVLDEVPEENYPNYARAIFTFIKQTYRGSVDDLRVVLDEVLDSDTRLGKVFQSALQAEKLLAEVRAYRDALPPLVQVSPKKQSDASSGVDVSPSTPTKKKSIFNRAVEPASSSDDEAGAVRRSPPRRLRKKRSDGGDDRPRHGHTPGGRPSA